MLDLKTKIQGLGTKALLFDLDDTLYDSRRVYESGLNRAWECFIRHRWGAKWSLNDFESHYSAARDRIKLSCAQSTSRRNRLLYFHELILGGLKRPNMALAIELHEVYATAYDEIDFEPALNILTPLRGRYRLGLVTNQTADAQFRKMKRLDPNGALFEVIMTSEQAGVEKPHPKIFSDALAHLKLTAASALMIGDNWEIDIEGASGFGIPAIHLDPAQTGVPPTLVSGIPFVAKVSELEDLLELL